MPDTLTVQQAGDWSVLSGNAASPWYDGGAQSALNKIPASGDTVNGKLSTNINFDVDQSAFAAGLAGLDLKGGYITFKEGITTYLKMAGDFTSTVAGAEVRVGTSDSVQFTTASDGTIYMNGAYALKATTSNNITWKTYCNEPTVKSIRLNGAEAVGQTELSVDTDVTSYTNHWKAGALIRIDDYNGNDSEVREIAVGGVAAGAITVTAGLTNAKISGAYIHLISRNFRILCGATTVSSALVQYGLGTINAEIRPGNVSTNCFRGSGVTIGGSLSGGQYGLTTSFGVVVNAILSGLTSGCYAGSGLTINTHISGCSSYGFTSGRNNVVNGAKITGCLYGIGEERNIVITNSVISGNVSGIYNSSGFIISSVLLDNTRDFYSPSIIRAYNTSLLSTSQVAAFVNDASGFSPSGFGQIKIDNYAGLGTTYAWMYAGTVIPATGGELLSAGTTLKYNPIVSTQPTYIDYSLGNLSVGQKVEISVYMKHSATGFTQRGKFEVFHWSDDTFFGGTAIYSWTAADNTDEQFSGYEFEALEEGEHILRISCKNASGNLFASAVFSVISEELTTLDRIEAYVDTLEALLGTPVALDGGSATIAGMLTKIADDNGGADFNAEYDSLNKISDAVAEVDGIVSNIAITGSPAYSAPDSYTLTTGTQSSGTYASVDTSNGVYHVHTSVGNVLDLYYDYTLAADEIAVSVIFKGRINSSNDSVYVQAYDWTTSAFVTLFTLAGVNTTTDTNQSPALVSKYTGTAANLGKVRIRIVNAVVLSSATLYVDQLLVGRTITNRSAGYEGGAVWIDTLAGTAGTGIDVNGTVDNPVLTLADAVTVAATKGLHSFRLLAGSSVTFVSAHAAEDWQGKASSIALGGQNCAGTYFQCVFISGIVSGQIIAFNCQVDGVTGLIGKVFESCLNGTLTLAAGSTYFLGCFSNGPAAGQAPTLDLSAGTCYVALRGYSGKLTVSNLTAGDILSFDAPAGQLILDATCTGGEVRLRGIVDFVNNGSGVTVTRDAPAFDATDGYMLSDMREILGSTLTEGASGRLAASMIKYGDVATPMFTADTDVAIGSDISDLQTHGDSTWATATGFAVAGDQMNLADNAITSGKFDESTAYPLVQADSGSTSVLRTGADSDTGETLSDQLDGIHTKTTNLPASPAAVGSAMTLADDAITSAKFDESTAFPVKSADTGLTALARTGADSDTLETLSDQIDTAQTSLDELLDEYDLWWDTANNKFYIYEKGTSTVYEEYDTTVDAYGKLTRLDKV